MDTDSYFSPRCTGGHIPLGLPRPKSPLGPTKRICPKERACKLEEALETGHFQKGGHLQPLYSTCPSRREGQWMRVLTNAPPTHTQSRKKNITFSPWLSGASAETLGWESSANPSDDSLVTSQKGPFFFKRLTYMSKPPFLN